MGVRSWRGIWGLVLRSKMEVHGGLGAAFSFGGYGGMRLEFLWSDEDRKTLGGLS
jgi:hypothetical protein